MIYDEKRVFALYMNCLVQHVAEPNNQWPPLAPTVRPNYLFNDLSLLFRLGAPNDQAMETLRSSIHSSACVRRMNH